MQRISRKLEWVLVQAWVPGSSADHTILVKKPDFWGPLCCVVTYAAVLLWGQFRVVPWVLSIWVAGSALLWFQVHALGSVVTLSQCLAVTGYSVLPLTLTMLTLVVFRPASQLVIHGLQVQYCTTVKPLVETERYTPTEAFFDDQIRPLDGPVLGT